MAIRVPEEHKKPGVCYAVTDDGVELPVVDVTHPAFVEHADAATIDRIIQGTVDSMTRALELPPEAQQAMRDRSILMRVMVEAADTYMTGMATYLYKLGPANLGEGYASELDRAIAAGITPFSMRSRLRHMARMIAGGLAPVLARRSGPLHLVNVAGGSAMDSINALILLWKEHRDLLSRPVTIHLLELDEAGPHFAGRALDALCDADGPLHGLAARLVHVPYDWANVATLGCLLRDIAGPDVVAAGSSEGGLFEYPTDEQMIENLQVLHDLAPADFAIVGTIVKDTATIDPRMAPMEAMKGRPTIRFIGVNRFRGLAERAGWDVTGVSDEAIHQVVRLEKMG